MRQAAVGKRLADEQLEDRQPTAIECMRRAREIDPPDTEFLFSDLAPGRVCVRPKPVEPIPERARIVLAQGSRVDQLEAVGGEPFDDSRYVRDLSAREDVFLDEIADAAAEAVAAGPVMRDAMVEHQPAGLEDAPDLAEVARVVGDAYMLEHADAGDLVEKPIFGQVEVVEQLHVHAVAETELGDFRLDVIVLILRQRDAECVDAVALRGAKDQRTPAAADVEKLLVRVEH